MATIEKTIALEITKEIKEAVNEIFKKHGMAEPKAKTVYGDVYRLTLETAPLALDSSGVINLMSAEAQYYYRYGFSEYFGTSELRKLTAPLGTQFRNRGETYAFGGIAAKRKKYPIVGINIDTKETMLFTTSMIPVINAAAGE